MTSDYDYSVEVLRREIQHLKEQLGRQKTINDEMVRRFFEIEKTSNDRHVAEVTQLRKRIEVLECKIQGKKHPLEDLLS